MKYLILLFLVTLSCMVNKEINKKPILKDCIFYKKDNTSIQFHFKQDNFVLLDLSENFDLAITNFTDTTSYGKWKWVNDNFIELGSKEVWNTFSLNLEISEQSKSSKNVLFIKTL